jgi:hypothetical protein
MAGGLVTVHPLGVAVGLCFRLSDVDASVARRAFPPPRIVRLMFERRRIVQSGECAIFLISGPAKPEEHSESTYKTRGRYPVLAGVNPQIKRAALSR